MNKELLKGLSEEQIAKIKDCKNNEEILALAKEEGIELTDEQLEAVSGGVCTTTSCPNCGSNDFGYYTYGGCEYHQCRKCKHTW